MGRLVREEVMSYEIEFCEVSIRSDGDIRHVCGEDSNQAALKYAERIASKIEFERYEENGLKEAVCYVDIHKDIAYLSMVCDGRVDRIEVAEEFSSGA